MEKRPLFRDAISAFTAFFILLGYIAYGFVFFGAGALLKVEAVTFPAAWETTFASMATMALGYLIGKETSPAPPAQPQPVPCPICNPPSASQQQTQPNPATGKTKDGT